MSKPYRLHHALPFALLMCGLMMLVFSLSGCGAAPVKPPASEVFSKMRKPDVSMPAPAPLPARPRATASTSSAGSVLAFDAASARKLLQRDTIAEQNTALASECSAGFNELSGAYGDLLDQARTHERMYNLVGQKWSEAEAQLQRQSVTHEVESWANRALLFLAVGLAL